MDRRRRALSASAMSGGIINNYLTIVALEDGLTASLSVNECEYCVDGNGDWKTLSAATNTEAINTGQTLSFRGNNLTPNSSNGIGTFTISKSCNLKGNCMSMLFGDYAAYNTSLTGKNYAFCQLFYDCTTIKSVSSGFLPATTLASDCYYMMFSGCTNLTTAPELPATTLADYCYSGMFKVCTSLTTAPELPATTLADACYSGMFYGTNVLPDCSNINFSSESIVSSRGLAGLFAGTKVTDADLERMLPKNSNGKYCLPATTLVSSCYNGMFSGCTSLTQAPELPATTLASNCYYAMFNGCTNLTTAPALPATTLLSSCYYGMFRECTSLTTAPSLPATTLASYCYEYMFQGCTSLTTAPELPATRLVNGCYQYMFYGCSKLNYIKAMFITTPSTSYTRDWVYGVASGGTFVKNPDAAWNVTGINGIPSGWTVVCEYKPIDINNYLTIVALEDGLTAKLSTNACEYCVDGDGVWKTLTAATNTETINIGQTLSFRGDLTPKKSQGIGTFTISKSCNLEGNCMSMLFGVDAVSNTSLSGKNYAFYELFYNCTTIKSVSSGFLSATTLADNCYDSMFRGCTSLTTAPELPATTLAYACYDYMFQGCTSLTTAPSLPATTLAYSCYRSMFSGCTSLTTAPELPATTLAYYCYRGMFYNCTNLTTAPELPATTLAIECYYSMFQGCTNLTQAPELPATTLAEYCYVSMFQGCTSLTTSPTLPATTLVKSCYYAMLQGCTSLTTAPELPATTLYVADSCYGSMFRGCSNLTQAPELPATRLAQYCYQYMFEGCTSLTTAPELPATTLADSCYGYMFKGCTNLTQAPELPATTLAYGCYYGMLTNCSKLNYIKMLATDISATNCLNNWVSGVASSGTFVKNGNLTSLPTGVNGIPSGWTVVDKITFYCCGIECQAEEGMTWGEWVDSEYNVINAYINTSGDIQGNLQDGGNFYILTSNGSSIQSNELILRGESYISHIGGGIDINNYLTIVALEDGLTASLSINICEYCVDGDGNWKTLTAATNTEEINAGQTLSFKGNLTPKSSNGIGGFTISKSCNLEGNCMSMLFGDNASNNLSLIGKDYALCALFLNCKTIKSISSGFLPATTLADYCYFGMFNGCNSLTTAPALPATTLANFCYYIMFQGCTSLTTAPSLPATTLADACYYGMFYGCTSLTPSPELPATTLVDSCYCYMFYGTNVIPDCSNIDFSSESIVSSGGLKGLFVGTKVTDSDLERILPKNSSGKYCLPVTTLTSGCYSGMFYNCTNLTIAPALPATTLESSCYSSMFRGCTSLTQAPELPATTLASYCYNGMFYGCTNLTKAPELPATTLASYCYDGMFLDCTGLTQAPELPATTLANNCYDSMFRGCTSLTTAPALPATTLYSADDCYYHMFYNCSNLSYVKAMFTTKPSTTYTDNWLYGVASTGTFVKNPDATWNVTGVNGIPSGWTVVSDAE